MVDEDARRRIWSGLFLVVTWGVVGCGGDAGAVTSVCPNDVPAACPAVQPSYATDVDPLLQQRCGACHTPGGVQGTHPFDTYAHVAQEQIGIESQLHNCFMPPANQPQPTAAERQIIFAWIVCGALDN